MFVEQFRTQEVQMSTSFHGKGLISRHVVFDESKFPFPSPLNAQSFKLQDDYLSR